ncbi:MAG: hypothetical protein ACXV47_04780 [Halobacteriota archaeon]
MGTLVGQGLARSSPLAMDERAVTVLTAVTLVFEFLIAGIGAAKRAYQLFT